MFFVHATAPGAMYSYFSARPKCLVRSCVCLVAKKLSLKPHFFQTLFPARKYTYVNVRHMHFIYKVCFHHANYSMTCLQLVDGKFEQYNYQKFFLNHIKIQSFSMIIYIFSFLSFKIFNKKRSSLHALFHLNCICL